MMNDKIITRKSFAVIGEEQSFSIKTDSNISKNQSKENGNFKNDLQCDAILLSPLLFGVLHAATILGGSEPLYVVLQILFAFVFWKRIDFTKESRLSNK